MCLRALFFHLFLFYYTKKKINFYLKSLGNSSVFFFYACYILCRKIYNKSNKLTLKQLYDFVGLRAFLMCRENKFK